MRFSFYTLVLSCVLIASCSDDDENVDPVVDQFNKDIALIDAYLEENEITAQEEVSTGIRYVVHEQGTGLQPYVFDSLTLSYSTRVLREEAIIDQIFNQKLRTQDILPGAVFLSTLIQEGGRLTAWVPSFYGYGDAEIEGVPANSVLMIDVNLSQVHNEQLRTEIEIIDDSLANAGMTPLIHSSGIRYFLTQGSGDSPNVTSNVTIDYNGKFFNGLNAGVSFDSGEGVTFRLQDLILGWRAMIPELKPGGEMTMILPSDFAYREQGNSRSTPPIPPNAILVFDVDLVDFN